MSLQLLAKEKSKKKAKVPSRPPSRSSVQGHEAMMEHPRSRSPVSEDNIGDRLREGVQKRLQEHALKRQAANARSTEELLDLSSDDDESHVQPRRVCERPCVLEYCDQPTGSTPKERMVGDYEGKVYIVHPNIGEPYSLCESHDIFAHWYANLRPNCTEEERTQDNLDLEETMGSLEAESSTSGGDCESIFKRYGNSVQHLLVMAIGLDNNGRKLADFDEDEIYKAQLTKSLIPKVPLMKLEMKRRAAKMGFRKFRKASVLKPEAMQWLKENPVRDPVDVLWLQRTEEELYKTLADAAKELEDADKEKLANANWTGNLP
jgi:hypothetical protein